MSRRSDREWVDELRAGGEVQRQAFAELGRYIYHVVYNYLYQRRAGLLRLRQLDASELEELAHGFTQETLETVWEKLSTYEGRGKLTSWAAVIGIRRAAYELRKPYWREGRMSLSPAQDPNNDPEDWGGPNREWQESRRSSPEAHVQTQEILAVVEKAIREDLTERQRFAFVGQFIEDRSSDEIAKDLDTTRTGVYMLIYEARKKIKRRLLEAGHTPEDVLRVFQEGT